MRTDILNQGQTSALALLSNCPEIDTFYLAGETALALHLGHRYSKVWQDFETKYAGTGYDTYHFLRALTYFDDAEDDPMLEMINKVEWKEVKKYLEKEVGKIVL